MVHTSILAVWYSTANCLASQYIVVKISGLICLINTNQCWNKAAFDIRDVSPEVSFIDAFHHSTKKKKKKKKVKQHTRNWQST